MGEISVFDIIGPRMVGPSSSHTAGANRLGRMARKIARDKIESVEIYVHGSFAKTLKGHGTDRALVAGLLGIREDDEALKDSFRIAASEGMAFAFHEIDLGEVHPNTVKFVMTTAGGKKTTVVGSSTGGGGIMIVEIDGLMVKFTGLYPTLITRHNDHPGVIHQVTAVLAEASINVAFMSVFRQDKGDQAFMVIESDDLIPEAIVTRLKESVHLLQDVFVIEGI
ncbi:MAG: L-serine ammonia-lyase, iron-sulfur-dependent subunit beta [Clostridia bacterium]|nr:L-serine ammonia-lyase, iron-sulfur-dependent subunit beta [Clostridia bacterium]